MCKKQFLLLAIILFSFSCFSQIGFEKGYFISNSGEKVECDIKNLDWKNNPSEFSYVLPGNSEPNQKSLEQVKEFGIDDFSKYERHTVDIDRSKESLDKISMSQDPIFKKEQLFLRVLVEGKSTLYIYDDGSLRRFFFKVDTSKVEQLIFKSFKTRDNKIGKNKKYKSQLWKNLNCHSISMKEVKNLNYSKNELIEYFTKYNQCVGVGSNKSSNLDKDKRDLFNLRLRPGLNKSSLELENSVVESRNTIFDKEWTFRFGVELEYILPFKKNKWSIILEPTFQNYNSEAEIVPYPDSQFLTDAQNVKVNYSSVEIPIGIRHYFFLNEDSKIFINSQIIIDFSNKSMIEFESLPDLKIRSTTNFAFGFGYEYDNKLSIELRYLNSRNILGDFRSWGSDYKTTSLVIGYSMF